MPKLFALATAFVAALSGVSAHYQLTYPAPRGFKESTEPTAPCGGFDSVSQQRTQFPLKNGFVEINSEHPSYTYEVKLIMGSNPSTADFTGSNATTVATGQRNYPEQACLPIDLGNATSVSAGTNATIQVLYNGGDGNLYQCTDVTFADNPSNFNTSVCVNADGSNPLSNSTDTSSA
ncbi:hypothetical protein BCR43DRAFT_407835, partial [Syncephalastrum racemosum]